MTGSIVDAHVHQWDLRATPREPSVLVKALGWNRGLADWVARRVFPREAIEFFGAPDHLLADYLPADYATDVGEAEVEGFVHVEAGWKGSGALDPVAETRWLEGLGSPLLRAIVGRADLCLGEDVDVVLRAHLESSPRFRGIRGTLSYDGRPGVMNGCEQAALSRDPTWRRGFARLAVYGLTFDATVYDGQLDEVADLARAFPDTTLVLCHAGTPVGYGGPFAGVGQSPGERASVAARWREGMSAVAEYPNVVVKISGLGMPIVGWGYHLQPEPPSARQVADDFGPLVSFLVDSFGAERCMFASNFPIDKVSMSWATLYEAFAATVSGRSEEERVALFSGTARRVYRLGDDPVEQR